MFSVENLNTENTYYGWVDLKSGFGEIDYNTGRLMVG